jgi:hypothetical protein
MSLTRATEESTDGPTVDRNAEPDVPVDGSANPAPLPTVPGLVMLGGTEDAAVCSDGTCR